MSSDRYALHRRSLLAMSGTAALAAGSGLLRPSISRAADRPLLTHGLQSGDVSLDSAIAWARADRPARAIIEWATTESFTDVRGSVFVDATRRSGRSRSIPSGPEVKSSSP